MICNVSEYLTRSAEKTPEEAAFSDVNRSITYSQLQDEVCHVAMALIEHECAQKPIALFFEKCVECVGAMVGTAKSGNFFAVIDPKQPVSRIRTLLETLEPVLLITDGEHETQAKALFEPEQVLVYQQLQKNPVDVPLIQHVEQETIDADLLCVVFTSGSTGTPKGVMLSQHVVIEMVNEESEFYGVDDTSVIATFCPLNYGTAIWDIFISIRCGAMTYLLPQSAFMEPSKLMRYLYDMRVSFLEFSPSALSLLASYRILGSPHLSELRTVVYGGSVLPAKHLKAWKAEYPDVWFVNLYGLTETAAIATAKTIQKVEYDGNACIGIPSRNRDIILLSENNTPVEYGEVGEICVRGRGLAMGYYRDPAKTAEVFVQNPLNPYYPDIICRTGDLARRNERGELIYVGRKDQQIKRMGHRIELGDIEAAASRVAGISECCCVTRQTGEDVGLIMFYTGQLDETELDAAMREQLPSSLLPNQYIRLKYFPMTESGKVDRQALRKMN